MNLSVKDNPKVLRFNYIKILASKLVEPLKNKIAVIQCQHNEMIRVMYEKRVPPQIKTLYETYPEWIRTTDVIYISEENYNEETIWFDAPVIVLGHGNLKLNAEEMEEVLKSEARIAEAKQNFKESLEDAKKVLDTLGSSAAIIEHFPQLENELETILNGLPKKDLLPEVKSLQEKLKNCE